MEPSGQILKSAHQDVWRLGRWALWLIMLATWFVQAMALRHKIDADGISYLDIGTAFWNGDWHAVVNGWWSPAYPILVGLWLKIWRPAPYYEFAAVRLCGCLMAVVTLISFEFLLKAVLALCKPAYMPAWMVRAPAYAIFFWVTTKLMPGGLEHPDLLVCAAVFVSVGISVKLASGMSEWWRFLLFGLVLGIGYLCKSFLFPLGFALLLTTAIAAHGSRPVLRGLVFSFVIYLAVVSPLVFELSRQKGRPTFGDVGALAYARYVDYIDDPTVAKDLPLKARTFKHPVRVISQAPVVEEFASPLKGTYALWLDPSYWYEGIRPYFKLRAEINVIHIALSGYFQIIVVQLGCLFAVLVSLVVLGGDFVTGFARRFAGQVAIWGPAAVAMAAYSIVHVDERYVGGFIVLLTFASFLALGPALFDASTKRTRTLLFAAVFVLGLQITDIVGHSASQLLSHQEFVEWDVADALHRLGIPEGGKVSYLGSTLDDHSWARLARVSIVSDIPLNGVEDFWASDDEGKSRALALLASTGSAALVTRDVPPVAESAGWVPVQGTNYFILRLPE